jgi:hypothetical protein
MPNPKSTWAPTYQELVVFSSILYSNAIPAVVNTALVNWKGTSRRVFPMAEPLVTAPRAKNAKNGRVLTPLLIAD